MWGAIRNDLLEFVNTVKADASKSIETVIGASAEEPTAEDEMVQLTKDLTRNFNTYKDAVPEANKREYDRFRREFSLASRAVDIGRVLDEEPDAARYYAELVPVAISAEEFWGRYFFKLSLLSRGALDALGMGDEEDEEEVGWEGDEEAETPGTDSQQDHESSHGARTPNGDAVDIALGGPAYAAAVDVEERERMRSQIRTLAMRVTELEKILTERNAEIVELKSRITSQHHASGASGSAEGASTAAAAEEGEEAVSENEDRTPRGEDSFIPEALHIKLSLDDKDDSGPQGESAVNAQVHKEHVAQAADAPDGNEEGGELNESGLGDEYAMDHVAPIGDVSELANLEDEDWENSWS